MSRGRSGRSSVRSNTHRPPPKVLTAVYVGEGRTVHMAVDRRTLCVVKADGMRSAGDAEFTCGNCWAVANAIIDGIEDDE